MKSIAANSNPTPNRRLGRITRPLAVATCLVAFAGTAVLAQVGDPLGRDAPHVGIPALAPLTGPLTVPLGRRGICLALPPSPPDSGVSFQPCVVDAECSPPNDPVCSGPFQYTPEYDDKAPGSPGPIFAPTDLIDLSGTTFDPEPISLGGSSIITGQSSQPSFGFAEGWEMRLDSRLNAYGRGQPTRRTDGFSTIGAQLGCAGVGYPGACAWEPNSPQYVYDPNMICTSGGDEDTIDCNGDDAGDYCAGNSLIASNLPNGPDGVSIIGLHSVTVTVWDPTASDIPCSTERVRFPFTVAVPELRVGFRGNSKVDVDFNRACPVGGGDNDCYKAVKVRADLEYGKLDQTIATVLDPPVSEGTPGLADAIRGLHSVNIPAHVRLGVARGVSDYTRLKKVIDDHYTLRIKKAGQNGKESWNLVKNTALSGRSNLKKLQVRFRDEKGIVLKLKGQADGLEGLDIHSDDPYPSFELVITFGDLAPGAPLPRSQFPTGQVVLRTSVDPVPDSDGKTIKRWRRQQRGKKLQKKDGPDCEENGGILQVNCPAPPNPNAPMDPDTPQPAMDFTAWNTFIALNWPALEPKSSNGYQRGIPDLDKRFKDGATSNDLTVWETFKNKAEIYHPPSQAATPVVGWNEPVAYGNPREVYEAPVMRCSENSSIACTDNSDCAAVCTVENTSTPPTGSAGATFPVCAGATAPSTDPDTGLPINYHRLDGTLQVRTEARESQQALCLGGTEDPRVLPGPAGPCTNLPGDPACCEVGFLDDGTWPTRSGRPVYSRVWKGTADDNGQMLVYEVKLNHDSFEFISNPGERYDIDGCATDAADGSLANLPWRSNQDRPPSFLAGSPVLGAENGGPLHYSARECLAEYQKANDRSAFEEEPCATGSVHLKAAWIPLTENGVDIAMADGTTKDDYHQRPGTVFRTLNEGTPEQYVCVAEETFGLVGLHVTQRTRQREGAIGGTWLFSTFEHVANGGYGVPVGAPPLDGTNAPPYTYRNWWRNENQLDPEDPLAPTDPPLTAALAALATPGEWFPPLTEPGIDVARGNPLPTSTSGANQAVYDALGCTGASSDPVWCNYRLTGIQWQPTDAIGNQLLQDWITDGDANDPTGIDQQFWLANLVIETNTSSQFWQGQPPRQKVIERYWAPDNWLTIDGLVPGTPPFPWSPPFNFTTKGFDDNERDLNPNCDAANPLSPQPDAFHQEYKNLAFRKRAFNMGGCIGCHANSQVEGYAFSFTAANGQRGSVAPATDAEVPSIYSLTPAINPGATTCDPPVLTPPSATCPLTAQP